MKKNKLVVSYSYEFDLLGVVSTAKEYKLAWAINNLLGIRLIKADDLLLEINDNKNIVISNFIFETEHSIFRLFKNKSFNKGFDSQGYLISELKNFDFLILINGFDDSFTTSEFVNALRVLNEIQYLQKVDVMSLKSKENLIF